ncbi:hypothetical protein CYLTODRAFT_381668 [Cylindrobasidium torrendii FP15055 ss-10]|uniref:RRM domain-containing protein n=1 Tax=Cylindrobasidium torrendii FP15055 ss-10 TaxID=1314674 RepID=A0A0D7B0Y6_9AGAR|nr:hypothetical protein CYLTODRAFT_381668 [Cylindrobasidium torrendii FP15055 ss-10]
MSFERNTRSCPPSRNGDRGSGGALANAVRVSRLPENVAIKEITALFETLIGDVSSIADLKDASGRHLEIVFSNGDACKKALCMNGYNIEGQLLTVVPAAEANGPPKRVDDRRNLYVLGLPFDLNKMELTALFSQYGNVAHCVILATLDSASRRRGFVVMASHEEARRAMMSLTRTQLRGHAMDISWAIVQRSQGFLDGDDRSLLFDEHSQPSRFPSPDLAVHDPTFPSMGSPPMAMNSPVEPPMLSPLIPSTMPTSTLIVSELPSLLFGQLQDMHPLLDPYGKIDNLELLQLPHVTPGTITAKVEYASIASAREALECLNGQVYVNFKLRVQYLQMSVPHSFEPNTAEPFFPMTADFNSMTSYRQPRPGFRRQHTDFAASRQVYAPPPRVFRPPPNMAPHMK